jgi:hypothetical protein
MRKSSARARSTQQQARTNTIPAGLSHLSDIALTRCFQMIPPLRLLLMTSLRQLARHQTPLPWGVVSGLFLQTTRQLRVLRRLR